MTTKTDVLPDEGDELRPDAAAENGIHESEKVKEETVIETAQAVESVQETKTDVQAAETPEPPVKKSRKKKKTEETGDAAEETVTELANTKADE